MRLAVIVMLAGCSVDRSALEDRVFECASDGDCAMGYICQVVDATGTGYCTRRTDPGECAGVSTEDEACLAECSVDSQESTMACGEGMECQRTDMLGEAGVCLATQTCSADSDCTEGENARCLSSYVLDEPNPFTIDHLSCVRGDCDPDANGQDDEGVCLQNEVCVGAYWAGFWSVLESVCLPRCGDDGACPPGFGCYAVNGEDFGPCVPGLPGMTCHSDLDCLAGTCEELNGEMRCLVPCEVGGTVVCSDEAVTTDGPALERLVCVAGACLVRDYLALCETSATCGPGFGCSTVDLGPDYTPDPWMGCVLACNPLLRNDACPPDAFCELVNDRGLLPQYGCWRKLPDGGPCLSHDSCASGFCDQEASCGTEPGVGCCAPSE